MAWSVPPTAAAGDTFTASIWNTGVRDNLNMTAPAIATTAGRIIVSSGVNAVAERQVAEATNDTSGTTTSTSYTPTLSGGGTTPSVTVTAGFTLIIFVNSAVANSSTSSAFATYDISGASTIAATDGPAAIMDGGSGKDDRYGVSTVQNVTPGSNTIRIEYRVSGATGTFTKRRLQVMPL